MLRITKTCWLIVVPAVMLLLLVGVASAADPVKGKTLWAQLNCKGCHGDNGEGKFAGPRAGDGLSADAWIKQARTPRSRMPSFGAAQVSDADIADMNAYMQTLPKPASFTPTVFPTQPGDPQGKVLLAQNRCVACHGDGAGLVKARFTDNGRTVTAADVIKQLRTPAQRMPSFSSGQVSDADATLIASYLASLQTGTPPPATLQTQTPPPATLPRTGEWFSTRIIILLGLAMLGAGIAIRQLVVARVSR